MKKLLFAALPALLLWGCYPAGPEYYEDLDVVITSYEENFDFVSKGTYAMPDKIVKISGTIIDGEDPEFVKEPFNTQILNKIEQNMTALGWEKVANPEDADITLLPASWTNTTIYYWYDYWCWYYYYCGWGWGYPSASSYTTGTLVMTLVADGDDFIEPTRVWTGAINGLLSGAYDINRVNNGIDQAFAQSPYLKTN
ncbi:MAG: DUF4136 domain-containing protein [Cyclobacteriaceae bacterium]|nr:DUF4136 domain-containing protein [Cyclobacteriaceae bacterium]MBX2956908.1 DUF4136 domain-containing protein [Cyclobacteriaceae bacterium]